MKVFDTNKNGKLEFNEAISAFCILCKGSVQAKLKYLMLAYSEAIQKKGNIDVFELDNKDLVIKSKNIKKIMVCVLRLALCSTPEIMLDYPVDKLAAATTQKCLEYCGVDKNDSNALVSLD